MPIESFVTTFFADWLNWTFFWWRTLFALSQNATACDNKLQIAVRNDMRLFLRFTKYYSSTTLYYKVHKRTTLHYKVYSVLQSATPVLLCTTQHYSVVQTTTPVLLCTTKYYSSTTLHYKVLLQYYSVLRSTTPALVCTTKYYSSTTLYYKVLNSSFYCESTSRKARVRNRMACVKKSQSIPIGACLRIVIYSLPSGTASLSKVIVKSNSSQRMGQVVIESKANVHIYIICLIYLHAARPKVPSLLLWTRRRMRSIASTQCNVYFH